MLHGKTMPGLTASGGALVFLGEPQIWGAEGDAALRLLGTRVRLTRLPRTLGGQIAEWIEDGVVLARARLVTLPASSRFSMVETGQGAMRITVTGLQRGWHLSVTAGEAVGHSVIGPDGGAVAQILSQSLPALVHIRLSEPSTGAVLDMTALWPARQPRLINADGRLLEGDREISLARLGGWRGHVPGNRGALVLWLAGKTGQVGFPASGEMRLSGMAQLIEQALTMAGADDRVNLRLVEGFETPRLSVGRYDWNSDDAGPFRHLGAGQTRLKAVNIDDPARTAEIEVSGRIDLAGWLGQDPSLWFVQAWNEKRGVMRPFVWAAVPQPHSIREDRLSRFAAMWAELLEAPADPGWDRTRTLIAAVRAAGNAGALDQVQALGRMPSAAVALLFMAERADRAGSLALETEAPIWWPLLPCRAWAQGVRVARTQIKARLSEAGIADEGLSERAMARAAGEIVLLRPELAAHLGQALALADLDPKAIDAQGMPLPLAAPPERLEKSAQEAGRRFEAIPQGTEGLRAVRLKPPSATNDSNATLMHAPLVAAEVAAGLRPGLSPDETLRLIALRAADPIWFDAALPAALTIAVAQSDAGI